VNGLDLFSGIGGLTLALSEWVRPSAYCEIDPYAQKVLLSRMLDGSLPVAPIWDDVRTLSAKELGSIDIIYGGFPCQDISVAGRGKGLAGERSGLFFEIMRLVREIQPTFIFLENVPAIRTRGLDTVLKEIADCGYDCRWTNLSAAEVGAWHKRDRWWLLAYSRCREQRTMQNLQSTSQECKRSKPTELCCDCSHPRLRMELETSQHQELQDKTYTNNNGSKTKLADTHGAGLPDTMSGGSDSEHPKLDHDQFWDWWSSEPSVGRVVNGLPHRVDRIKCLGNAVVPEAARQAFMMLSGMNQPSEKE